MSKNRSKRDVVSDPALPAEMLSEPDLFRLIFDTAFDFLFAKDTNGRYTMLNQGLADYFERPKEEVIGLTDTDLFEDSSSHRIEEEDARVLAGERVEEKRHRRYAGQDRYYHVIKVPLRNAEGEIHGICGIARDLTRELELTDKLRLSSERYSNLAEQIPGAVFSYIRHLDGSRSTIYLSPSYENIVGKENLNRLNSGELDFIDLIKAEDRQALKIPPPEEPDSPRFVVTEYRVRNEDGKYRWMESRSRGELQGNGDILWHGLLVDIQDRKKLEAELTTLTTQLQGITDSLPGLAFSSVRRPDRTRSSCYYSPGLESLIGAEKGRQVRANPDHLDTLIHPDDFHLYPITIQEADENLLSFSMEYRLRKASGDYRWVHELSRGVRREDGGIVWNGILLDVDNRKRIQAELDETSERLSSLVDGLPGVVYSFISDVKDRRTVLYHSPGLEELVGPKSLTRILQSDEFLNLLLHPDDRGHQAVLLSPREPGRLFFDHEFRLSTDSGDYRWVHSRASGTSLGSGNTLWHGILLNIDSRKRAEEQLHLASEDLRINSLSLEQVNRSLNEAKAQAEAAASAKGLFLANMSHEIRTPLTGVIGLTEILAGRVQDPESMELLKLIQKNGEFLLKIINDILDLSKIEAGHLSLQTGSFDPDHELREAASLMSLSAQQKGLELRLEISENLPDSFTGDATRLRQILVNLLSNAIKFTNAGTVILRARIIDEPDSEFCVEVLDTGIGIDMNRIQELFNAFVQGDDSISRTFEGTGLGLTISKSLAELMGGRLEAATRSGGGSCFRLLLPANRLRAEPQTGGEGRPAPPDIEARVLLAEDNPTIQVIVQAILEKHGYRLDIVTNGAEAIELEAAARKDGDPYDAILMDIQMPVMDGLTATRTLRKAGSRLPIIALTAHAFDSDRQRFLDAGCDDHCSKPIDSEILLTMLARHILE